MKTDFPIIFRPKKWLGIKLLFSFALIAGITYPMVRSHLSDAWILLVLSLIFILATIFIYFLDFDKVLIFDDKMLIYQPFNKTHPILFTQIEKIIIWQNDDSDYGDSLGITIYTKDYLKDPNIPSKILFQQYTHNSKIKELLEFFIQRLPDLIVDQRDSNPNQ